MGVLSKKIGERVMRY